MKSLLLIVISFCFVIQLNGKEQNYFTHPNHQNTQYATAISNTLLQVTNAPAAIHKIHPELPKFNPSVLFEITEVEFETVSFHKHLISTLYYSSGLRFGDLTKQFKETKSHPTHQHHLSVASSNSRQILFHNFRI